MVKTWVVVVLALCLCYHPTTKSNHVPVAIAGALETHLKSVKPLYPSGLNKHQREAYKQLSKKGWAKHWTALDNLVRHESGWNPLATNPSSGAFGIPQALPCSKMHNCTTNPKLQIAWLLGYVEQRYGDPSKAWHFWQYVAPTLDIDGDGRADNHNWY